MSRAGLFEGAQLCSRACQQSAEQCLVDMVVLIVVEVWRFTAESLQHKQYTDAMSLKLLPARLGTIVVLIEEEYILHALDVGNTSFTRAQDPNGVSDVSV